MTRIGAVGVLLGYWSGGPHLGKRWSRRPRLHRPLLLMGAICFTPVLLPLMCLAFPLVCAMALCSRFGGDRPGGGAGALVGMCEDGGGGARPAEGRLLLLDRYLEDQMGLVGSAVGDCDGVVDDDDDDDVAGEGS